MAHIQSIPISSITKETARTEQLVVRVMKLWYRKSETNPKEVKGVELILIDENGDTIQASINQRLTRLFLEHLNEGSTYKIRRFSVSSNRVGLDMATIHPCKIWFEYSTRVVPISNVDIPLSTYAFYTFNEVVFGAMPNRLYIDVIERLEHVYPIRDSNGKRRRTIVLGNNLNQNLCCSLFGDYVQQISEIEQEFINKPKPTLGMLFVKRSVYEGEVSITLTWGVTKILVNPDMNEVNVFNNSFPNDDEPVFGAPETAGYHPPILASAKIKTLTKISNLTKGGAYVTMAKIIELDTSSNNPDLVEFVIWDDVMVDLLGKTAQAILDEDEMYSVVPPPDFRPLLDRTFVAKIRVTDLYNIEQKSNSFGVISLCEDPRTIAKWDAMNNARKEQVREIVESEPVLNSQEITPQKGVVEMAEASDKSSATKLKEIKMGVQIAERNLMITDNTPQSMSNPRVPLSDITNVPIVTISVSHTPCHRSRRTIVSEQLAITTPPSNVSNDRTPSYANTLILTPNHLRARTAREKRQSRFSKKRAANVHSDVSPNTVNFTPATSNVTELICSPTDVVERLVRDLCAEYGEAFGEVNPSVNRIEQSHAWEGYWDYGDAEYECEKCHALMWFEERKDKRRGTRRPKFSLCCSDGKVELAFLQQPPELIKSLLTGQHRFSNHYRENIRAYNSMFSFISMGGKIDHSINQGKGPYTFRMGGQNCHRIGTLVPTGDARPKFCQLYIYDTEEEVQNRKNAISPEDPSRFNDELIRLLENMIDSHNTIAKTFRKVRDRLTKNIDSEVSIKLIQGDQVMEELTIFQQFQRLNFIRFNQDRLRVDNYKNLSNVVERGDVEPSSAGTRFIVPSSFPGGDNWKKANFLDTMTIFVYSIEFQKRGLPHAHIVLFLHREGKFPTAADVDKIISAEIPDPTTDQVLHSVVCKYMLHGPCGKAKPSCQCMVGDKCSKYYPKPCTKITTVEGDGYPIYKRSKKGVTVIKDDVPLGNDFVIPYNSQLLLKYRARINVEWCNQSRSIKEACYALELIGDDREYITAINEAADWGSGFYLRNLFATLLFCGTLSMPSRIWDETWKLLSDDILHRQRTVLNNQDLQLTDEELQNYALIDIENSLQINGSSLRRFEGMLFPDMSATTHHRNSLVMDALSYDRQSLSEEHEIQLSSMTDEQRLVYNEVMEAALSNKGGVLFVYGYGGTGKTFLWRALCACFRNKGDMVVVVASSGIAATLIPGGVTAHSRFGISINVTEDFICSRIKPDSDLAELLIRAKLIIWDEAPMTHRHCFEALDKSLKDVMHVLDVGNAEVDTCRYEYQK
ncbi:uncharacterized protein LOC141620620 [Silene latifolia]|uniref:uncharacterized protein LOC141620620 n=1 Tax=Silene latifolia TaxID=37657 RepID=UPI003D787ACD